MGEDFALVRSSPALTGLPVSSRGWVEHRSRLDPYPSAIRPMWILAAIHDCLKDGRHDEARARAALGLCAYDQAAVDAGSWVLSQELLLEPAPPYQVFSRNRPGAEGGLADSGRPSLGRGAHVPASRPGFLQRGPATPVDQAQAPADRRAAARRRGQCRNTSWESSFAGSGSRSSDCLKDASKGLRAAPLFCQTLALCRKSPAPRLKAALCLRLTPSLQLRGMPWLPLKFLIPQPGIPLPALGSLLLGLVARAPLVVSARGGLVPVEPPHQLKPTPCMLRAAFVLLSLFLLPI